ncbi:MAG: hypothetical protein ABSD57_02030 [Verrucomicrobiota bacterium]|jgi:hypothetical protein
MNKKLSIGGGVFVCLFATILFGCGPSASQIQFRQAVAAMKVCTQNATYAEFREKRMALETCYTANQAALNHEAIAFAELARVMDATDILWNQQIQHPDDTEAGVIAQIITVGSPAWDAAITISPEVKNKAGFTYEQREHDPDFYAPNYVRRGLTRISKQCDELLAVH